MFTDKLHRCSKNWKFFYYLIWKYFFLAPISSTVQSWISHRRKWVASAKVWCNFSHAPAAAWKTRWYVNNRVCRLDDFFLVQMVQTCLNFVRKSAINWKCLSSIGAGLNLGWGTNYLNSFLHGFINKPDHGAVISF